MSGGPPSDAVVLISGGRAPPHQKQSSSQSSPVVVPSPSHSTPKRRKLLVPRRRGGSGGDLRACWGGGSGGEGTMPATAAADVAISAPIAAAAHHRHHHPHHHHGSVRQHHVSARALADITPRFTVGASGGNADLDLHRASGGVSSVGASGGSVRITHLVSAVTVSGTGGTAGGHATSGVTANAASGAPRFPKLDECAHFHYENVELGPVQVSLCEEELKPLSDPDGSGGGNENRSWVVQVTSLGRSWLLRRSYDNFRMLDSQLHRCVYDRKYSALPELPPEANVPTANPEQPIEEAVRCLLTEYLSRLTCLAGGGSGGNTTGSASLINCGPVLNWLELDNRGHRLLVTDDSDINTPAVAAAYAVRRYTAQAPDEISFEVGDMISVIDMPPPEESIWWRGKRGFEVGFFPCECVALIGEKVPRSLLHQLVPASSQQPSASPPSIAAATGPSSPPGTAPAAVTPASSCASTASSSPSPASSAIVVASPSSQPGRPLPSKPVLRKHGKLIAFFRSFILSRPSRRRLKQSGILKERVFGCDLGEHLLNSGHEIPMVLKCCAEFIETNGIVDGIYRLSGVTSNIQKLRNAFDEDRVPGLYEDEAILQDIHSVASLLKMYFRELPNPLCTYHLYHRFVGAVQAPHENRLALMREVVKSLPPPHYRTLEYLMKHLARVAQRGGETGMTPRNVAIVWAPNLLRCKELEVGGVAALQGVGVQAVVTEFLVCYADLIFGTTEKGALAQRLRQRPAQHLSPDQHKLPPDVSPNLVAAFAAENATPKRSRPKSLAISTPTKLLSLEEARTRALLAATGKADQEYIEVGGGPANLPAKYHTVIDVPARKRGSLKSKRSPGLGWKAFFSKKMPLQQRQQSSSSLTSKRNILGGGYSPGASGATASSQLRGMVSPSELRTQEKAMTESDLMQNKRRLRPVKSAESLSSAVASAGSSTRNSAALDLEIGLGSIEGVLDQITGQSSSAMIGDTGLPSSPSVTGKPSHSRSVSHDSYFDHLAEPVLLMTEEDVEQDEEGELGESENLEGLLDLSEIQLDFELEEREMRIFSEDETLVSTTPIGSGGSLSRSPLLPHPTRRRLIGSPQGSGPRARPEDTGSSADPSPKKKKSGTSTISPGARKRSKVEAKSKAAATSSSPSPVSSPVRSAPVRPPSSSMPSVGQRSCFGGDDEDEEEELRFIDSQSPEPMPPSTTSFHRTSPTSYMSRQSSHSPSSNHNHYSQPYQQQQVVVHAEVHPSPSEDASSLSRADATVSDNESFTVHGGETSSEGDLPAEAAGAHPENEEEEDDEDEGGVLYSPLVNDATAETTPVEQSTPAYENVPWVRGQTGALNGDDQITTNLLEKRKCPAATPRNLDSAPIGRVYQNIGSSYSDNHEENNEEAVYEEVQVIKDKSDLQRTTSPISSVTRRNDVASTSLKNKASKNGEADPEEVYQQVKAFRKSVQEVNEILGGVSEQTQLPKMDGQQNKTLRSEGNVQNSRETAANEQCAMVKEVSANSELLSSSNGSSEESSDGRMPSEEMALLRTPSGRSGLSVSGTNRRASLPASSTSSFTEDSHRRRFDSEIGRDILRERRVKLELERVRGEPGSGVSSPVSSDGTGTRLTPSPVSTPQRTLSPAPPKSPASMQTSERHSPAPSASSASTVPPRSPVPPQSPAPPRSPAPSSSPVPSHSPAPSRSPAFSHSSAPPRSPAPSSSSAPSHSPAPVHSPVPSLSPLPPQSPAPCSSPVYSRSPAPPLSPASPRSPVPPISPASPHSPLPVRSPLSPLPPYSPISHSPALSPISPTTPKSPSYPLALSPTNSVNSPSHMASTSIGASCLRSPTIPMDLPSGPNSSSSSPARTPFKKNDENHRSVSVGTSLTDVTADSVKNSSAKKDSAIKTLENGFESGCRGWGSEGGSLRGLPGRSWSVSDSRRLAVRKASVRELLSRFEGKEGGEGEEKSGRRASAPSHRRPTPPCLRARASRSSPASALSVSLDEERFLASAREATNSPSKSGEIPTCNESPSKGDGQLIRVRTSPDINTEAEGNEEQSLLMEQQSDSTEISNNKVESGETHGSLAKMDAFVGPLQTFSGPDDPERRERIERYKRERRSFLREKYRSESFREERDEVLKRLKQKVSSVPQESRDVGSEGECRSRRRTRCTVTEGDPVDDESKITTGKLSSRSRWRATSSESDEAGEGVSRVGVSPVLSRSPNCRYGGVPASPTLSLGTPWDVAALFEAREQTEKVEKGEKSRELP